MKDPENKIATFSASSLSDWERAATEELQGADPWTTLTNVQHGMSIKPYYGRDSAISTSFQLPPAKDGFLGPRRWYNCPRVMVLDPALANKEALQHLQQGADGVFFEMEAPVDLTILLQSIDWPSCSLHFLAKSNADAIAKQLDAFLARNDQPSPGAFFAVAPRTGYSHPSFRFQGHVIPALPSPVETLASGIAAFIGHIGKEINIQAGHVAFTIEVAEDFFMEIAKLRALRIVWGTLLAARGVSRQEPLYIHAFSPAWTEVKYAPHSNLLKSTTSAMSAILGGCDALTIDPEDSRQPMMGRVARNVSNILREESHLSLVADPISGSFFVEDLTRQLAEGTLAILRKNEIL